MENHTVKIPTYDRLMNPLFQAIRLLGGSGTIDEVYKKVVEISNISDDILEIPHGKTALSEVQYRLAWARTYLRKYGLLENSSRGVWSLTSGAKEREKIDPKEVVAFVRNMITKKRTENISNNEDGGAGTETEALDLPEETQTWRQELHDTLGNLSPDAFEWLTQRINGKSSVFAQQYIRTAFRDWLMQKNPSWGNSTLNMLCSDALYLYNNERGITLTNALTDDDGLEKVYDLLEQHFTAFPRQTGTAATAAKGYTDALRLFKEFLAEKFPELLHGNGSPVLTVPQEILDVLSTEYTNGFRFDTTALRLLSNKSGIEVDNALQSALKRQMFSRGDNIYFLLEVIADEDTQKEIVNIADKLLDEYGCFEISELYVLYEDRLNRKYISNADDFEKFYEFINTGNVRCVVAPNIGNRIARFSNGNVWNMFNEIAAKIVAFVQDEYGGTVSEEDLHSRFYAFSSDLLAKIIKNAAEELVRTEINGIIVYQTLDALGLTDEFSNTLQSVLVRLDDIGIAPSVEALHTALSLAMDVNFNAEFNIPDKATYQRLIAAYYKAEPPREWKGGVFLEVSS